MNFPKLRGIRGSDPEGWPRLPDVCWASVLLTFLLCRPRLDPGSAARPGNSQGIWAGGRRAGREEGVLGRRRAPPVGLSAPPTPSGAEPAPARRSRRRRRGRSRLQEPLETESRQRRWRQGQRTGRRVSSERRAQVASPAPEGIGAQRGAPADQFGSRLPVPGAGKRDGGRERRKEGRRE